MVANNALNELSSHWQPFEECFEHLLGELRNMDRLATSLSTELETMQHELLRRAHMVENLQAELSMQRQENIRLVARCENQEQHMHEEFASLRAMMQTALANMGSSNDTQHNPQALDVVKYAKREGLAS